MPDSITIERFPMRRSSAVWIVREDGAWLVLAGENGWLHGSHGEADSRRAMAGAKS